MAAAAAPIAPALAGRTIQIDTGTNANPLTSCAAFAGCLRLNLSSLGTSILSVFVSPTGHVELVDGYDGGPNRFFVGSGTTQYQVLSGFTTSATLGRIDFVDFYQLGDSTALLPTGNRPTPDFQIQFRKVTPRAARNDLEIAFAYDDAFARGGDHVSAGAAIGYSGATLGVQPVPPLGPVAGFAAERLVTNSGGLRLGTQAGDSDFVFVVGDYLRNDLLTGGNPNKPVKTGLVSETFAPVYAAVTETPEPSTWGMLAIGAGLAGAGLRRRRGNVATA